MAPQIVDSLPPPNATQWNDADWIFEPKVDGYRALLIKDSNQVQILSRKESDLTPMYPHIAAAGLRLNAESAVVDGEIAALDADGAISFQALQHRDAHPKHTIVFYVFDLIHRDGRDLMSRPIERRRTELAAIVGNSGFRLIVELPGSAASVVQAAATFHQEGVLAKRRQSPYTPGPRASPDWLKYKIDRQQEFVIGGFRPNGNAIDELAVGYYDGTDLHFAGRIRAGFTAYLRNTLFQKLQPLQQPACPFVDLPTDSWGSSRWGGGVTVEDMKRMRWVRPALVAQIAFKQWTHEGRLRLASFRGLRDDKAPEDVRREQ